MERVLEGWHLKKEVAVGNIITMVAVICSGLWWASTIEKRVSMVEVAVVNQEKRLERDLGEIKHMLRRIDDKIDRKADK